MPVIRDVDITQTIMSTTNMNGIMEMVRLMDMPIKTLNTIQKRREILITINTKELMSIHPQGIIREIRGIQMKTEAIPE